MDHFKYVLSEFNVSIILQYNVNITSHFTEMFYEVQWKLIVYIRFFSIFNLTLSNRLTVLFSHLG